MARMRRARLPLLVLDHTAIPLGHLSPELSTTSSEVAGPSADVEVASSRPSSQSHAPTSPADPASDADSPDYHQILRERRAANRAHGIDLDRPQLASPRAAFRNATNQRRRLGPVPVPAVRHPSPGRPMRLGGGPQSNVGT